MSVRLRKRWCEADIAKLRSMAGNYPTAQIAQELGRGLSATVMKAYELRISLRRRSEVANNTNLDPGPAGLV
jgi:hypothetical protein